METKKAKEFIDHGFGFPVRLKDVTMVRVRGAWTPKINYAKLAEWVLLSLSRQECPLSGNEIRFVRNHFEMTLKDFAARFQVSHVAVLKWEKSGDKPASVNWATEKDIRLFIQSKLSPAPSRLARLYEELTEHPAVHSAGKVPGLGPVRISRLGSQISLLAAA